MEQESAACWILRMSMKVILVALPIAPWVVKMAARDTQPINKAKRLLK